MGNNALNTRSFISTQLRSTLTAAKTINQWHRAPYSTPYSPGTGWVGKLLWYPQVLPTCRSFGQIICHILLLFRALQVNCLPIYSFFLSLFFLFIYFFACCFCLLCPLSGVCTDNWNKDNFETVVKWKLHGMCALHAEDTGTVTVTVTVTVPVPVTVPIQPKKACFVCRFL